MASAVMALARRHDQVGVGAVVRAPDPAAQLVQLRQAELVGAVDDDGVGGRHVDAAFDDGGADQHVEAAVVEIEHDLFQIALAHLAVGDRASGPRAPVPRSSARPFARCCSTSLCRKYTWPPRLISRRQASRISGVVPLADEGLDRQPRSRAVWR